MLTESQKIRVFECLDITYGPGASGNANVNKATIHNHYGIDTSLTEMNTLRDEVLTTINTMSSEIEADVIELLNEWNLVRLQTVTMSDGSAGDISGASMDPEKRRAQIRSLMARKIGVMDIAESIRLRHGAAVSRVIFAR